MSLTLTAQPAHTHNLGNPTVSYRQSYHSSQQGHSSTSGSSSHGASQLSGSSNSASHSNSHSNTNSMASALPNLFLKHARSLSLEKHQAPSPASLASHANGASTHAHSHASSAQSGVNGHASTSSSSASGASHYNQHGSSSSSSSPATASSSTSAAASSTGSGSFIRSGDVVYDHGPPPPAPVPAVGTRSYTVLKEVGDGSFGTVWLADWHSPLALPKGTGPPGPSSRPEYKGKRLVALKRMKKAFEGGWEECMRLKELKSLRSIPLHANIIPLYDAFILPTTKELYFVFECMEGNLYQLTKSRKGRPLAAGLVAHLLHQMLAGLHHIHQSGYFHRDMKPENLLITTTGLADYPPFVAPHNAGNPVYTNKPPEKDVVAIVKIADFGLARETRSRPPYTEYVSTRWYRAPEVLLRSRDYSNPVDMWAVGTILAEMVNLKPLFPGQSEVDQVYRICELMGDPSPEYGHDERGRLRGGGGWERGIKMARSVGFQFPKIPPASFSSLFDPNLVPVQLVEMMQDLMRYDPKARLTTQQCLEHSYFSQVATQLRATPIQSLPNHIRHAQAAAAKSAALASPNHSIGAGSSSAAAAAVYVHPAPSAMPSPRTVPSSHSQQSSSHKPAFDPNQPSHAQPSYPNGLPGLPPPSTSNSGYSTQQDYYSASSQSRDRHASIANSLVSNDSVGLGGMHVNLAGSQMSSPGVGYPESVIGDVNMDGADEGQSTLAERSRDNPSPVPSSIYSFGQGPGEAQQGLPLPLPNQHHLPQPNPMRQGANGYAASTHSSSYYNPSIYSGYSNGSGRRGSAGGASTFYDGSIFEGIAPTRAASILSFPASYGEAPPSPKFHQPSSYAHSTHSLPNPAVSNLRRSGARHDSDNFTVDFEREALQRSQNQAACSRPPVPPIPSQHFPKSDSQESLKVSGGSKPKDGKSGRGWMASVFSNSSSSQQPPHNHPQQQPLIHPPGYPASSSASIHSSMPSSGTSLKRTPSERSVHDLAPPQPALPLDPKKAKKEAERIAKEAEKIKRDAAQKAARDRARAVMQKRNALAQAADPLHNFGQHQIPVKSAIPAQAAALEKEKLAARERAILEARKQQQSAKLPQIAEDGRVRLQAAQQQAQLQREREQAIYNAHGHGHGQQYSPDVRYKARRRDDDDDVHSMSSNETRSERRFSISSHATGSTVSTTHTMDSDPGPSRQSRGANQLLPPVRRTPSVSSFGGQSHLSVGSQHSGHHGQYARRDLGTGGSNASSLEHGLVGRFQGLTAAEQPVDGRPSSVSPTGVPGEGRRSPLYQQPPHQAHAIVLPPIQSFDQPPKEFNFANANTPRTSHSTHSNNSTLSGNSGFVGHGQGQAQAQATQGLPFTQEMYRHQLQQRPPSHSG